MFGKVTQYNTLREQTSSKTKENKPCKCPKKKSLGFTKICSCLPCLSTAKAWNPGASTGEPAFKTKRKFLTNVSFSFKPSGTTHPWKSFLLFFSQNWLLVSSNVKNTYSHTRGQTPVEKKIVTFHGIAWIFLYQLFCPWMRLQKMVTALVTVSVAMETIQHGAKTNILKSL